MKRQITGALLAAGIALAVSAATALPAAAATSGSETLSGTIVTSGVSGTRTEISSVLVAKGVFNGVGKIVELPDLPTDPPNSSRDDLVFPGGTMHLVSGAGQITGTEPPRRTPSADGNGNRPRTRLRRRPSVRPWDVPANSVRRTRGSRGAFSARAGFER